MKHQRPDAHAHTEPADTIPSGRRKLRRAAPQPLRLEPRLMFDGAALATTAEVVHEPQPALDTHVANANEIPTTPHRIARLMRFTSLVTAPAPISGGADATAPRAGGRRTQASGKAA